MDTFSLILVESHSVGEPQNLCLTMDPPLWSPPSSHMKILCRVLDLGHPMLSSIGAVPLESEIDSQELFSSSEKVSPESVDSE